MRWFFLLSSSLLMASCGGGGGSGGSAGSGTPPAPVAPQQLPITQDNAEQSIRKSVASIEAVLAPGLGIGRMLERYISDTSNDPDIACDQGSFQLDVVEESGDGILSTGDVIAFKPASGGCVINNLPAPLVEVELSGIDVRAAGEFQVTGTASLGSNQFEFAHQRGFRGETTRIWTRSGASIVVAGEKLSDLDVLREEVVNLSSLLTKQLWIDFSTTVTSQDLDGVFDCSTNREILVVRNNTPIDGVIECRGAQNSAARHTTTRQTFEIAVKQGDGSFQGLVSVPWQQLIDTALFDGTLFQAAPSQLKVSDSVLNIQQDNNHITVDDARHLIYVTVGAAAETNPSSVVVYDATATQVASVELGGEPDPIALSSDGNIAYVGFKDKDVVVALDTATLAIRNTITLPSTSPATGPDRAVDIEVSPLSSDEFVVSLDLIAGSGPASVAKFKAGAVTNELQSAPNLIRYLASGQTLYGFNNNSTGFEVFVIDDAGDSISIAKRLPGFAITTEFTVAGSEMYTSDGQRIDPNAEIVKGRYENFVNRFLDRNAVWIDEAKNRVYFLDDALEVYDKDTYLPVGFLYLGDTGINHSLEPLNETTLVAASETGISLVKKSTIKPFKPDPCSPENRKDFVYNYTYQFVSCRIYDALYNERDNMIYMSVSGTEGANTGNRIVKMDGNTLEILSSAYVGAEPGEIELSDDGTILYAGIDGSGEVIAMDTDTLNISVRFRLGNDSLFGPFRANDIEAIPKTTNRIAVNLRRRFVTPKTKRVVIYEGSNQAPLSSTDAETPGKFIDTLVPSDDGSILFGFNGISTGFDFSVMPIDQTGIIEQLTFRDLIQGFATEIVFDNNLIYASSGHIVDVTNPLDPVALTVLENLGASKDSFGISQHARIALDGNEAFIFAFEQPLGKVPAMYKFDTENGKQISRTSMPMVGFGTLEPKATFLVGNDRIAVVSEQGLLILQRSVLN